MDRVDCCLKMKSLMLLELTAIYFLQISTKPAKLHDALITMSKQDVKRRDKETEVSTAVFAIKNPSRR